MSFKITPFSCLYILPCVAFLSVFFTYLLDLTLDTNYLEYFPTIPYPYSNNNDTKSDLNHYWDENILKYCLDYTKFSKNTSFKSKIGLSPEGNDPIKLKSHFLDILNKTEHLRNVTWLNITNPMITLENYWINNFSYSKMSTLNYGPFIPLFILWDTITMYISYGKNAQNKKILCKNIYELLNNTLEYSYYNYITLTNNDQGIMSLVMKCHNLNDYSLDERWLDNILQISAGGYGHIPIPNCYYPKYNLSHYYETNQTLKILLSDKLRYNGLFSDFGEYNVNRLPRSIDSRHDFLLGTSGTIWDIRYEFQKRISNYIVKSNNFNKTKILKDKFWVRKMCKGKEDCSKLWPVFYSECCKFFGLMRGRGPTTRQLCEFIQLAPNTVPIFIYDEPLWLPYEKYINNYTLYFKWPYNNENNININNSSCDDNVFNLKNILTHFYENEKTRYNSIIEFNRRFGHKYFNFKAILKQIKLFLIYGPYNHKNSKSDLHCTGNRPYMRKNTIDCRP